MQKLLTFFSAKILAYNYAIFNDQNFNDTLTNVVNFEQMCPDDFNCKCDGTQSAPEWFLPLKCFLLMLSMLGKHFSRQHFEICLLFLPDNRLWHFMQYLLMKQLAWNMKTYILWKIRKMYKKTC